MPKSRVLIVDDDERILDQLVLAFEEAGFDVATATDASGAHMVLSDNQAISLVVTDIGIRGSVNGLMLGHMVAQSYPEIPIIIISGLARPDDHDVPAGAMFLAKPVSPYLLVQEAERLLATP